MGNIVKILFELPVVEDWPPFGSESLWAEYVGEDRYRLDNIPFFVKGVSYLDIIQTRTSDNEIIFDKIYRHCGHSTYRVIVSNYARDNDVVRSMFISFGCGIEGFADVSMLAVDVPPSSDVFAVYKTLEGLEHRGTIGFEEGFYYDPDLYGNA